MGPSSRARTTAASHAARRLTSFSAMELDVLAGHGVLRTRLPQPNMMSTAAETLPSGNPLQEALRTPQL